MTALDVALADCQMPLMIFKCMMVRPLTTPVNPFCLVDKECQGACIIDKDRKRASYLTVDEMGAGLQSTSSFVVIGVADFLMQR
jgi:hypothetical protein